MVGIKGFGGALPLLSALTPVKGIPAPPNPDMLEKVAVATKRMNAAPDSAATAEFLAVQAHSVIRKDGRIAAIQWRDGTTEIRSPGGQGWDKERLIRQGLATGLSKDELNDLYVRDLARTLGAGVAVDRYGGRADAPTRGELVNSAAAGPARGQRLSVTA
ncbi:hypothetical protein [Azospirillum picis]|uniref:Uncharacterized protein n=1 Tax=Azospirillum picis TaxID=488438 RepID=A0ABU0MN12_9PROT|nr:hypothetical protein [Azospirillum picis]MBP2301184.1 hypothetical protein [Azospirillum picis]MDQ0534853.1 hypothetical protein [Azospirillum picis]